MPDTSSPIPLTRPSLGERELAAVATTFDSGWVAGQGPQGALLESGFRELTGRAHAIAVNNCTAGLHLALHALGVREGDEVIVPDYTFPATAYAPLFCGATPVLADVDERTGCLDVAGVGPLVTERTRAVIGVDALGVPADWHALTAFARAHDLALVEDAACAAGGRHWNEPCGSFGDVAVFSLHARKGITSGEGGVVVTDDDELARRIRAVSCFGMASAHSRAGSDVLVLPEFDELGWNYKLADVLAAIGVVQLSRLDDLLALRRQAASRYATLLEGAPGVRAPDVPPHCEPTWQTYAVTVDEELDRDALVRNLRQRGVGCNIGTYSLSSQSVFRADQASFPRSQALFARHLAIPMFDSITEAQQERVVDVLMEALVEVTPT